MYKKVFTEDIETYFTEIKTRPCKDSDLNDLDNSNSLSNFYPINKYSELNQQFYGLKLKCIDNEELSVYGNYDSGAAQNLMVVFERCDPAKRVCKSETEFQNWLSYKFLITLENTKVFR